MISLSKFCLNCLDVWEYLIRMIFRYFAWASQGSSRIEQTSHKLLTIPATAMFHSFPLHPRLGLVLRKRREELGGWECKNFIFNSVCGRGQVLFIKTLDWPSSTAPSSNSSQCWEEISKLSKFLHKLQNSKHWLPLARILYILDLSVLLRKTVEVEGGKNAIILFPWSQSSH